MLDAGTRNALLSLPTPLIADAWVRLGLPESHLDPAIRPVVPFSHIVGAAVTALLQVAEDEASADLQPLSEAYELRWESSFSVMVIQVPTELHSYGIVGGGAATRAVRNGFSGFLVDGASRDTEELRRMEFPVFSRKVAPGYIVGKSTVKAIGHPVVVGG